MRWGDFRRSDNVEDRTGGAPEGGGGGLPFGGGMRLSGGALIVIVIVGMLFGINPFEMLGMLTGDGGSVQAPPTQSAPPTQPVPPGYGPQSGATTGRASESPTVDVN
jgi:predicted metalloprotease